MMAFLANNRNGRVHYWAGRFPGRVAWLFTPDTFSINVLRPWIPYALDNGAWKAYQDRSKLDVRRWYEAAKEAAAHKQRPLWTSVPDVVGDAIATRLLWEELSPKAKKLGIPLAFVAQDGTGERDIPADANLVFIGGTTEWKLRAIPLLARIGKPLHVGRVNTPWRLYLCSAFGVQSFDGTGWFRGGWNSRQARQLEHFLANGSLFSLDRETIAPSSDARSLP